MTYRKKKEFGSASLFAFGVEMEEDLTRYVNHHRSIWESSGASEWLL